MKIHFRMVDGERRALLGLADGSFCEFGTGDRLADLPGEPLRYADMNSTVLKRIRDEHFLDVAAGLDDTDGTLTLRLPDPVTLLKTTRPGEWKQARERVAAEIADMPEFQAFAQWWETLRRSDAYRRDCEAIRGELDGDEKLVALAFAGNLDAESCCLATCFMYALYKKGHYFEKTWGLPRGGHYYYMWPEFTNAEDVTSSLACFALSHGGNINHTLKLFNAIGRKKKTIPDLFSVNQPGGLRFRLNCDIESASRIATGLFLSKLPVTYFSFNHGASFTVQCDKPFFAGIHKKVVRIVTEAIGTDLPTVQPWNERKTRNPEAFRRELAAFDKRTDEDAELWPGKSGQELSKLKYRARERFKERLARLEHAAEERRRTLTTD